MRVPNLQLETRREIRELFWQSNSFKRIQTPLKLMLDLWA